MRLAIELKKHEVALKGVRQAIAELISAAAVSNYPVCYSLDQPAGPFPFLLVDKGK